MTIVVKPMESNELADGLVLARLGHAPFDERALRDELETLADETVDGGALLARNGAGRPCGLILYRILIVQGGRPSLQIVRLVAFDLTDPQPIADALVDEVFRLACAQGCETLRTVRFLTTPADTIAAVRAASVAELHSIF
ncbi:hypothetical protein [Brevundimonas subvibrioides]|uniref:hypothetical protein n=1 Tax=Brevundimonas subvibrioides TaxID=74313 RepID=UPI0022B39709|nr:hypothetical protein [Brevundimonas subvibrioides]